MNKIYSLLDEKFIAALFREKVLPLYPAFTAIEKITVNPIKKNIWQKAYHIVIEYQVLFKARAGQNTLLYLYTSAHDKEPRKNVFTALSFLWDSSFSQGDLTIPRPLFFLEEFNAVFYRGVKGKNLYHYIIHDKKKEVEDLVQKTALWLSKLHSLETTKAQNFNELNGRIETIIPGRSEALTMIKERYPDHLNLVSQCYEVAIKREEEHLDSAKERCLIHGDAHTENIIKVSKEKIAFIDFTDICLGDFARDLGTFLQQFEFKARRKMGDGQFVEKMKKLFLDTYLKARKIELTAELEERIKTYYYWTSIRTAIFLFLFHNPQPERAVELLKEAKKGFDII